LQRHRLAGTQGLRDLLQVNADVVRLPVQNHGGRCDEVAKHQARRVVHELCVDLVEIPE
jgi:hypothetical protein